MSGLRVLQGLHLRLDCRGAWNIALASNEGPDGGRPWIGSLDLLRT